MSVSVSVSVSAARSSLHAACACALPPRPPAHTWLHRVAPHGSALACSDLLCVSLFCLMPRDCACVRVRCLRQLATPRPSRVYCQLRGRPRRYPAQGPWASESCYCGALGSQTVLLRQLEARIRIRVPSQAEGRRDHHDAAHGRGRPRTIMIPRTIACMQGMQGASGLLPLHLRCTCSAPASAPHLHRIPVRTHSMALHLALNQAPSTECRRPRLSVAAQHSYRSLSFPFVT